MDPIINLMAVFLGAMLALGTTYFFEKRQVHQRELGVAYSLIFKIQYLVDQIVKMDNGIGLQIRNARQSGFSGGAWQIITDFVGFKEPSESIFADELALIARTKDVELVTKVRELESGHSILLNSLSKICELRVKLSEAGVGHFVDGRTVSYAISEDELPAIAPIIINLDDLSASFESMIPRIAQQARETAGKIGGHLKSHYKFQHFISLSFPSVDQESTEVQVGGED